MTNFVYDELDRLVEEAWLEGAVTVNTVTYAYDAVGNLVLKTEIATSNYTEYAYDHRNRMVSATEKSAAGIILSEASYTYDVFDRRIARIVDADGAGPEVAEETRFVYDGNHVWADFDASQAVLARYLFGDSVDELIARYRPGEGTAWHLADHLGTVRDIVDASGVLIDHIDYDSFGNVIAETNPTAGDRYKFTGREWDGETGLYYYRARYYDPGIGRFISEDPIAFAGGDANLYRYVGNSPLNATDPSGNVSLTERAIQLGEGPVGALVLNRTFGCFMFEVTLWSVSRMVMDEFVEWRGGQSEPLSVHDGYSVLAGTLACSMLPASAVAQGVFLLGAEVLYMAVKGTSWQDMARTALFHTMGVAGGAAISRYAGRSWSRLDDAAPHLQGPHFRPRPRIEFRTGVDDFASSAVIEVSGDTATLTVGSINRNTTAQLADQLDEFFKSNPVKKLIVNSGPVENTDLAILLGRSTGDRGIPLIGGKVTITSPKGALAPSFRIALDEIPPMKFFAMIFGHK